MKRKTKLVESGIIFFILCVANFLSCTKQAVEEEQLKQAEIIEPVETFVNSVVLSQNASLMLPGRDGEMHSIIRLTLGKHLPLVLIDNIPDEKIIPPIEIVEIVESDETKIKSEIKTETAHENDVTNFADITETVARKKYLRVVYDDVDFWILETAIAQNARTAVIIENAPLYIDKNLSVPMGNSALLKFGTIVAASNASLEDEAQKVYYFEKSEDAVKYAFVNSKKISTSNDDYQVMMIVEKLAKTTRATARNDLFLAAEKYKPCPSVKAALDSQHVERVTNSYTEVMNQMKKLRRGVSIDELKTVDVSKDPFK